jgi:HEAT repeat protein
MAPVSPAGPELRPNAYPAQRLRWGRIITILLGLVLVVWGGIGAWSFVRASRAIGRLSSANADVRSQAATELGALKSSRAVPPLIAALSDGDSAVRISAATALGEIGDPRALQPLLTMLKTDRDNDGNVDECHAAAKALGALGKPALDPLLAALQDKDPEGYAAEGLERMGAPAVNAVAALLQNQNADVATEAALILGEIKDRSAAPPLLAALSTGNSSLRYSVVYALGEIKDASAVAPVAAVLKGDPEAENRRGAADALGMIGDAGAIEPLIAATADTDSTVRRMAAGALGRINNPRAANFLIDAFRRRNWDVIVGACEFFIRRGEAGTEDTLIEALKQSGDEGMAEAMLNSGNDKLHDAAADWAGNNNYEIQFQPGAGSATWGKNP